MLAAIPYEPIAFDDDLATAEAESDADRLFLLAPKPLWHTRSQALTSRWREGLAPQVFLERYRLELAVAAAIRHQRITGRYFGPKYSYRDLEIMSFCHAVAQVAASIPSSRLNYVSGRLRQGLDHEAGLRPFALELATLNHATKRGFEVTPVEMKGLGQFDFLVSREGRHMALDCKYFDSEKGIAIKGTRWADAVERSLKKLGNRSWHVSRHVSIVSQHSDLAADVAFELLCYALASERDFRLERDGVTLRSVSISDTVRVRAIEIANGAGDYSELKDLVDLPSGGHTVVRFRHDRCVVLSCGVLNPKDVTKVMIADLLKDTKRQLPGLLPGSVVIELAGLNDRDFMSIFGGSDTSPLVHEIHDLFLRRPHVLGVCLIDGSGVPMTDSDRVARARRRSLVVRNQAHELANDPHLNRFWTS